MRSRASNYVQELVLGDGCNKFLPGHGLNGATKYKRMADHTTETQERINNVILFRSC